MEPLQRRRILDKGYVELLSVMGDDNTVVAAARVSYLGESKGEVKDKKLITFMMKHGHTSPFEHVVFQWRIKCPLFVRSQWHRHRTWSYNELSRRYTDESIDFYIPEQWRKQDNTNKQGSSKEFELKDNVGFAYAVGDLVNEAFKYYNYMLEQGVAKEMARMILPQNLYTIFYGTVDLHNLFHFMKLRSDSHAQWEIQQYSLAMEDIIKEYVPWTYEAWNSYRR